MNRSLHQSVYRGLLVLAPILLHTAPTYAQVSSTVTCLANSTALFNSRNQDPCFVGAWLGSVCANGQFSLPPLQPGQFYNGPDPPTDCTCSTVVYSMISACGVCQAASSRLATWTSWSENCTRISVQTYPSPIPTQITVPHWAYADVTIANIFDPNVVFTDIGPESSAPGSRPQTTSRVSSPTGSPSNSPAASSSGSSTNVGAIVGGVVGGVVVLAGIALGVWFCLRRRKRGGGEMGWKAGGKRSGVDRKASIFSVGAEGKEGTGLGLGLTGAGTGAGTGGGMMMDPGAGSPFLASPGFGTQAQPWNPPAQQRLYDPNDPSTFPTSSTPIPHSPAPHYPQQFPNMPPQYTGNTIPSSPNPFYPTSPASPTGGGRAAPGTYTYVPEVQ